MSEDDGETLQGVYTGAGPDETRLDPLTLICELSLTIANDRSTWDESDFALRLPEFRMLEKAAKILMLNARHVPTAVDEILAKARESGGLPR